MSSQIAQIYETLLASKSIVLSFDSQRDLDSIYAQLRTIKSRYDKKYLSAFDESLSEGKVIRYETIISLDGYADNAATIQARFFLGDPKPRTSIQFKILSINPLTKSSNE